MGQEEKRFKWITIQTEEGGFEFIDIQTEVEGWRRPFGRWCTCRSIDRHSLCHMTIHICDMTDFYA